MIITALNGQTAEAFDLIMKKEYAMAILQEKKAIEYRDYSSYYTKRLFDNPKELEPKPINVIHFHDYNKTWFLDVQITCAAASYLNEEFLPILEKYHELGMIEQCKANKGLKLNETPICCFMPIVGIINTNLVNLSDLAQNKFIPLQEGILPWDFQMSDDYHRIRWSEAYPND